MAGKLAWITGGSSGIGREVARQLAGKGWRVAVSARSADELAELATAVPGIIPIPLDVTDDAAVSVAAHEIQSEHGPIDLVLLAAGVWFVMDPDDYDQAKFRKALDVNVMGVVAPILSVLPAMRKRRQGHIAIVSSVSAYRGLPRAAAYGPTKAALTNLAETLRGDLVREGIKIQVIHPGFVDTPMTKSNDFPMPFIMTPEKAAAAILRGLDSNRFEISFPWQLVTMLKLAAALPYGIYFWFIRRFVAPKGD